MAFIYKIQNDIDGKCYIGRTEKSIYKRFREHCHEARWQTDGIRPLYAAMNKYGQEHFHVSLIEETTNPYERENYWINKLQTCVNGYNLSSGGNGNPRCDHSKILSLWEEGNTIRSISLITNYDKGTISKSLKKNGISNSEIQARAYLSMARPVEQIDLQTNKIVHVFPSIAEAARSLGSIGKSTQIIRVLHNKNRSAFGYGWKYSDNCNLNRSLSMSADQKGLTQ